jgi:hypothetical protein
MLFLCLGGEIDQEKGSPQQSDEIGNYDVAGPMPPQSNAGQTSKDEEKAA